MARAFQFPAMRLRPDRAPQRSRLFDGGKRPFAVNDVNWHSQRIELRDAVNARQQHQIAINRFVIDCRERLRQIRIRRASGFQRTVRQPASDGIRKRRVVRVFAKARRDEDFEIPGPKGERINQHQPLEFVRNPVRRQQTQQRAAAIADQGNFLSLNLRDCFSDVFRDCC